MTEARRSGAQPRSIESGLVGLVSAPGRLLVVADFDGTLADFDPDPMGAVLVPSARPVLRRLARLATSRPERLAVVILSGRVARDVAVRVRVGGLRYLGNHGNEAGALRRGGRPEALRVVVPERLARFEPAAARLGSAVAASLAGLAGGQRSGPPAWLFVEPKGPAVAFHYRAAPDPTEAHRLLDAAIATAATAGLTKGFARIDSRLIVEFQPIGAGAKGEATRRLLDELAPGSALVLGDDRPDAEAFAAIREAQDSGRLTATMTIAVRHGRPLAPEVVAAADAVVEGTRRAVGVLRRLVELLEAEEPSERDAGSTRGPRSGEGR